MLCRKNQNQSNDWDDGYTPSDRPGKIEKIVGTPIKTIHFRVGITNIPIKFSIHLFSTLLDASLHQVFIEKILSPGVSYPYIIGL